jgi:choline dehydrogenase-like flavoprotein
MRAPEFIVIGSGPGGATVARELAKKKKKVLILEWGSNDPLTGGFRQGALGLLMPGKSLLVTGRMLALVRGIIAGGSSVFYYATAFQTPFDMLRSYGVDIEEEIAQVRKELPIAPLKGEMIGPMASRIMESAMKLGDPWRKLDKFMYQDRWRPDYPFGHYGDPHGVKWSARMFLDEALGMGAEIIDRARVSRVLVENGKAVGVEYVKKRRIHKVYGSRVILSAGGIGTPIILRSSGIKGAGYNLFLDPVIVVRGSVKDMNIPASEIPMVAGIHMADEGYMMTDMAWPSAIAAIFAAGALRFDKMFSRRNTLQIMIKAKDELGGKITERGGVRKRLARSDKMKLMRGYERGDRGRRLQDGV